MKYMIRRSLKHLVQHSYLKDEGALPEENVIDCSLGINPCGVTPKLTREVYSRTFDAITSYPSHPYRDVCRSICNYFSDIADVKAEQISMQNGSMGALRTINFIFLEEGARVLAPAPCFSSYTTDVRMCGAVVDSVPLPEKDNFIFPVEAYIQAMNSSHRIAYLDNPNNPTGQALPLDALRRILEAARDKNILVLVDEAYGDFLTKAESAVSLINEFDNLIVTRTFSKGFGLGALRAGYIVMPEMLAAEVAMFTGEMNLTTPAEQMIPVVLADPDFLTYSRNRIRENSKILRDKIKNLKMAESRDDVPISLIYTEKNVDLGALFWKYGIRVENGVDFEGIGERHVRLRVPEHMDELLSRISQINDEVGNLI